VENWAEPTVKAGKKFEKLEVWGWKPEFRRQEPSLRATFDMVKGHSHGLPVFDRMGR